VWIGESQAALEVNFMLFLNWFTSNVAIMWSALWTARVIIQSNSLWRLSCTRLCFTSKAWLTSYWQTAISKVISNTSHTDYSFQKLLFTFALIHFQ